PLYARILVGLLLGLVVGVVVGPGAKPLELPAQLILRVLGALAPPLILVAIVHAILTADIRGAIAIRLGKLLVLNTLVAIFVGLLVANLLRPGRHAQLPPPPARPNVKTDVVTQLLDNLPDSLLRPFVDNKVIGVVLIAVAFGVAARSLNEPQRKLTENLTSVGFSLILKVLGWVIALVPLAVFGKVASIVGVSGFGPFVALGMFVLAVLVALGIQATYYLTRIRFGSWVRPRELIRGTRDALIMAFSTASSTLTMPVTYDRLRSRIGLRERSASLGSLVGSNFNNDGTALYEAMAALFIAQLLGLDLSLGDQVLVVLTSVVASVGAAGIPEAGLVTMTLVFTAVKLPTEYIALLLSVDWFLDRCRTTINVLGDMNVSCLLDGKERAPAAEAPASTAEAPAPAAEAPAPAAEAPGG
ncbi:MAG TPA: dicarboxylate/amino acid:cation symporter, partial [Polyangiaceae bacterium]|nr:dicarboxylate/amino acid:cation symporter [Polyangiaceae bacterium]